MKILSKYMSDEMNLSLVEQKYIIFKFKFMI